MWLRLSSLKKMSKISCGRLLMIIICYAGYEVIFLNYAIDVREQLNM